LPASSGLKFGDRTLAPRLAPAQDRSIREFLPVFFWPVTRCRFRTFAGDSQIKDGSLPVIMKRPRIDEKPLRRDHEIMAALGLTDARRLVMSVKISPDLASELLDDDIGACCATARLVGTARKALYITHETGEPFSQQLPLFTFCTGAHATVIAAWLNSVNTDNR